MKSEEKVKKGGFYIVYSPDGPTAPVVRHPNHGAAFQACHHMAAKHPGKKFYVMKKNSRGIVAPASQSPDMEGRENG